MNRVSSFCAALGGVLTLLVLSVQAAEPAAVSKAQPEPSESSPVDIPGLPRVLLIGDSISIGYTPPVRALLNHRANVHHPAENCSGTAFGLKRLDAWLGSVKWDVIHFNFGLHDLKYCDAEGKMVQPAAGKQLALLPEYEANLRELVARLKKTGATLIFATSTPVPAGSFGRIAGDELRYNAIAIRVMREAGVPVDDLHSFVVPRQATMQQPRNVHFTDEGSAQLAGAVVASIGPAIPGAATK